MGAMHEEVSGIVSRLRGRELHSIGGRSYWSGNWHGVDVTAVFSRWGKVASAATAAILLDRFQVDHIVFVGVAGAVDPALRLGDVVVADELVQHDMDASAVPPLKRFEIPLLGRTHFSADAVAGATAVRAARLFLELSFKKEVTAHDRHSFSIDRPCVHHGLIASGDIFMADAARVAELRAVLPGLLCVEMEGAAVAQVCFEMATPLTVIRIVSDHANHQAPIDFPRFTAQIAAVMTEGIVGALLAELAQAG